MSEERKLTYSEKRIAHLKRPAVCPWCARVFTTGGIDTVGQRILPRHKRPSPDRALRWCSGANGVGESVR